MRQVNCVMAQKIPAIHTSHLLIDRVNATMIPILRHKRNEIVLTAIFSATSCFLIFKKVVISSPPSTNSLVFSKKLFLSKFLTVSTFFLFEMLFNLSSEPSLYHSLFTRRLPLFYFPLLFFYLKETSCGKTNLKDSPSRKLSM